MHGDHEPGHDAPPAAPGAGAADIFGVESNDPLATLVDRSAVDAEALRQIDALMAALARLRAAERSLADAALAHLRLNETDMRAIHFLIVCDNRGDQATAGAIAAHLGISTAATTKLLDRLERRGHVKRHPHPSDRRALVIAVTPATKEAAIATVGRHQARRFYAAVRLSPAEREVVTRFLDDMTTELTAGTGAPPPKTE